MADAAPSHTDLEIAGMNCASCVGRVERALKAVPGVSEASVNLVTGRARVTGTVPGAELAEAVRSAGYRASVANSPDHPHGGHGERAMGAEDPSGGPASHRHHGHDHGAPQTRQLMLAAALTLPIVVIEMGGHLVPAFHHWLGMTFGERPLAILQFLLATAVLAGPGRGFFRVGWPALRRMAPDMDSLVMMGAGAAWAYSTVATFLPEILPEGAAQIYFEAAAVVVTLILLGRTLEARARGRAGAAISRLVALQPHTARIVRDGSELEVPAASLAVGDMLRVRPGERLPVDGTLIDGGSWVDESMMTGEPAPVEKGPGSMLVGGTIDRKSVV